VRPVLLVVLDGYGLGAGDRGDCTTLADAPLFRRLDRHYPHARLLTSGAAVGLPDGQMGNSEVGHMTLGAGRVIDHDLLRIQKVIDAGALARRPAFATLLDAAAGRGALHLLGLVSAGGVHSSLGHLEGILDALATRGLRPWLHAFTDGRDTPPESALEWIEPLERLLGRRGGGIATVCGRYYAMDRDRRFERVARAYDAIVARRGEHAKSAVEAVKLAHARGEGDEFIAPTVVEGAPALCDGDVGLFFNFRADRARELTNALTRAVPAELGPEIQPRPAPRLAAFATWTIYDQDFELPAVFGPAETSEGLGELLARRGLRQLRIAETEKYAHVTYFFNGGVEPPLPGEDRILVDSPRDVPTYDLKPEMSAVQVTDRLLEALGRTDYDFVLVNYANADMVGHTGVIPAGVRAVEVLDVCLDRVTQDVLARGGTLLITADHGNVEQLIDPRSGGPHTAHTTNPVPCWWVVRDPGGRGLRDGTLADVAPTLCELLEIPVPAAMQGESLLCAGDSSSS
jgi:2,3-bisphosphoglycerate-independent phosphoglycerate mutase